MPTIAVDNSDTVLSYLDSGPVDSRCYTTFVLIHGGNWYNGIFKRLLDLAPKREMRLICLNRRDFPGSTPYGEDEVTLIQDGSSPENMELFRAARGHEVGRFICNIIKNERLPPIHSKATGVEGGVALLGWSLGNSFAFAMLAHMRSMNSDLAGIVQKYMHTLVVFDPPHFLVGPEDPPDNNDSLVPQLLRAGSPMNPYEAGKYLSSYFRHEIDEERRSLRLSYQPEADIPSSVSRMSPEQISSCLALDPPNSEHWWRRSGALSGGFRKDTHAVLFPSSAEWRPRIRWVYCEQAMWHSVWAAFRVQAELDRRESDSKTSIKVVRVREANHFVHWDDPEKMMDVLDLCLRD